MSIHPDPAATAELVIGDILVKDGHRYEYRGERKLAGADGFLLCDLDGTYLEGSAPRWAPDFALSSFELAPRVPKRQRPAVTQRSVVDVHLPDGEAA